MNRYSSARSSLVLPRSSTHISQDMVYMQMSHHYRRLLNAKSNVDSSPPRSFRMYQKSNRTHSHHRVSIVSSSQCSFVDEPSPSEMALVDKIVYDDKHRPEVIYRDHLAGTWNHNHQHGKVHPRHDCTESHKDTQRRQTQPLTSRSTSMKNKNKKPLKVRAPVDLIDRHQENFESPNPFKPRILKSNVPSRVRDLKVYHPPRRKSKPHGTEDWNISTEQLEKMPLETVDWLEDQTTKPEADPLRLLCAQCQCGIKTEQASSKVSIGSRDSAYNGGVSSGGESRGPTPEQANLMLITKTSTTSGGECVSHLSTHQSENLHDKSSTASVPHKDGNNRVLLSQVSKKQPKKSSNAAALKKKTESKKQYSKESSRSSSYSPVRQRKITAERSQSTEEEDPITCKTTAVFSASRQTNTKPKTCNDVCYAEFSEKITADILSRDILSNEGINDVFEKHIKENMEFLDMTLMQREVEILRIQLGIVDNVNAFEDTPSHFSLDVAGSPYVRSNLSDNTLVRDDDAVSSILSDLTCPAPCSTRYATVDVHSQLLQSNDLPLANSNELQLWLMNNMDEHNEREKYIDVTTPIPTEPKDIPPEILSSPTEATEGLNSTESNSLKDTVREIIDEILSEHIDYTPNGSMMVNYSRDYTPNGSMMVNYSRDYTPNCSMIANYSRDYTPNGSMINTDNAFTSHSLKYDQLPSQTAGELEGIKFRDELNSSSRLKTPSVSTNLQMYSDNLAKAGNDSVSYHSDSLIKCCFKKKKKKSLRQKLNDELQNPLSPNINQQEETTVQESSSLKKPLESKDLLSPHIHILSDASSHRRSKLTEQSSSSSSSVEDIDALQNFRERQKKQPISKQSSLHETIDTHDLDNDKERKRFHTF